jgi:hypothetical protein
LTALPEPATLLVLNIEVINQRPSPPTSKVMDTANQYNKKSEAIEDSSIINHQSSIINHQSSIINHQSSIINHQSSIKRANKKIPPTMEQTF